MDIEAKYQILEEIANVDNYDKQLTAEQKVSITRLIGMKGITDLAFKLRKVMLYSDADDAGLKLKLLFIVRFQQVCFITEQFSNHLFKIGRAHV